MDYSEYVDFISKLRYELNNDIYPNEIKIKLQKIYESLSEKQHDDKVIL